MLHVFPFTPLPLLLLTQPKLPGRRAFSLTVASCHSTPLRLQNIHKKEDKLPGDEFVFLLLWNVPQNPLIAKFHYWLLRGRKKMQSSRFSVSQASRVFPGFCPQKLYNKILYFSQFLVQNTNLLRLKFSWVLLFNHIKDVILGGMWKMKGNTLTNKILASLGTGFFSTNYIQNQIKMKTSPFFVPCQRRESQSCQHFIWDKVFVFQKALTSHKSPKQGRPTNTSFWKSDFFLIYLVFLEGKEFSWQL